MVGGSSARVPVVGCSRSLSQKTATGVHLSPKDDAAVDTTLAINESLQVLLCACAPSMLDAFALPSPSCPSCLQQVAVGTRRVSQARRGDWEHACSLAGLLWRQRWSRLLSVGSSPPLLLLAPGPRCAGAGEGQACRGYRRRGVEIGKPARETNNSRRIAREAAAIYELVRLLFAQRPSSTIASCIARS